MVQAGDRLGQDRVVRGLVLSPPLLACLQRPGALGEVSPGCVWVPIAAAWPHRETLRRNRC